MNNVHQIDKQGRQARVQSNRPPQPLFTDCPMSPHVRLEKAVAQLPDGGRQSDLPAHDDVLASQYGEAAGIHPQLAEQFPPTAYSDSSARLPDTERMTKQGSLATDPGAHDETDIAKDADGVQLALGEMAGEVVAEYA